MMPMNNMDPQMKLMELMSNPTDTKRQIEDFASTVGGNPKQQVEELINSGRMSQGQYNMLSKFANMLMRFM